MNMNHLDLSGMLIATDIEHDLVGTVLPVIFRTG